MFLLPETLTMKFRPVADWAKSTGVAQFLYISSAGIYKTSDEVPHVEGVCIINQTRVLDFSLAYFVTCLQGKTPGFL